MTTTTNTIFYDSFTLDAAGETVGADLNGKAVEQSSIGTKNWTSASVYYSKLQNSGIIEDVIHTY
ncbi:MAG: hypothetical protein WCL34_14965, partial [Methylococcaceae bacterium]